MKKIAAVDVGLKRVGLSISLDGKTPIPQNAIIRKNRKQAVDDLKIFLQEWEIEELVVGLPKDGKSSDEMERRIRHFINLLDLEIPIFYQDEQNSSNEAKEMSSGVFKHTKDGKLDSLAASLILERYLS